jgi:hypothetical protein
MRLRRSAALLAGRERHVIALSAPVMDEIAKVLRRPRFAYALADDTGENIQSLLATTAVWVEPVIQVTECRDAKHNKYLELRPRRPGRLLFLQTTIRWCWALTMAFECYGNKTSWPQWRNRALLPAGRYARH